MSERAKAAYAAYGEVVGWKNFRGDPMPQWSELPEVIQRGWDAAGEAVLSHWLENDFRAVVGDDRFLAQCTAAHLTLSVQRGDFSLLDCLRYIIIGAVRRCVHPNAVTRQKGG